ncbi:MAG: D-arabinono-1,4-lactone oxidase [Ornithinimicrobium sp.]
MSATSARPDRRAGRAAHTNWAGNVTFGDAVQAPDSVREVQRLVAASPHAHAVGTGHSFTPVADTRGALVSTLNLPHRFELGVSPTTGLPEVTIAAGMTFAQVAPRLDAEGLALHNMGSLPHISAAGACSTGTHGSGDRLSCLAAAVSAVEMVIAGGELVALARDHADFAGVFPSLGALGICTALTFEVQPSFDVAQTVWQGIDAETGVDHVDQIMASAYSVSVFTVLDPRLFGDVWVKRRMDEPDADLSRWGGTPSPHPLRPVPGEAGEGCTVQGGIPGPWFERLPHFTPEMPPSSSGAEVQTEYYVTRQHGPAALAALWEIGESVQHALRVCELRTVAADGLWLSPACDDDLLGIHFTWRPDPAAVRSACRAVEAILEPFNPVPHWGKVSFLDPEPVSSRYSHIEDVRRLVQRMDPDGVFRNEFTDPYLRVV